MHARHFGQLSARSIELGRAGDHLRVTGRVELILLQRGRIDADSERLAEDDCITCPGARVPLDLARMHQAHHDEPVDRLDRVDRMAAGDRDSGGRADRLAAFDDAPNHFDRQLVDRHPEQRERHDRCAAHRVDVRDRVGRRDAPEVEGIVDDRHEEVGRRDQRLLVVQLVDGGVVGSLDADQQLRRQHAACALQYLAEHAGRDLAAAAAAVRERGEFDLEVGGRVHFWALRFVSFSELWTSDRKDRSSRRGENLAESRRHTCCSRR